MLGMKNQFIHKFEEKNIEVHTPDVVQTLSENELIKLVPQFDGWIIGDDPATRAVFKAGKAGNLKAAVKWGIGVDNVDLAAAKELGIPITNTPNMFGHEVADVAMGYIIGLARELFFIDRAVRTGKWLKPGGISLQGKKVGLIGFGDIGYHTAKRLLVAEMPVIAYDPAYLNQAAKYPEIHFASWPQQVEICDFLVFTCSLNSANYHLLNTEILARCKTGVRIINVARGPLIDESALIAALKNGKVHSAALDVMEVEPLRKNSPLRTCEKCIFGSHNASNTVEAVRKTSYEAMNQLFEFLGVN